MTLWCESCLFDDYDGAEEPCINCVIRKDEKPTEFFPKRPTKPMTNADRIRSMSDEELAKWICNISDCPYCPGKELDCRVGKSGIMTGALDWLKAPVEVQDGT